jgi:hypothetical protein
MRKHSLANAKKNSRPLEAAKARTQKQRELKLRTRENPKVNKIQNNKVEQNCGVLQNKEKSHQTKPRTNEEN